MPNGQGGGAGGLYAGGGGGAGSSFGPTGSTFSSSSATAHPEVVITFTPDTTPPAIAVASPVQGASYTQGQTPEASYSCADDGGSGLAGCTGPVSSGQPLDTSTIGSHAFTVTATDNAGNESTQTVTYTVQAAPVSPTPPASPNPPAPPAPPVAPHAPSTPVAPMPGWAPVTPPRPLANLISLAISGERIVGRVLVAWPGTGSAQARLRYHWQRCMAAGTRCRNISLATAKTYRLTRADTGHEVRVVASATDAHGHTVSAAARPVGPKGPRGDPAWGGVTLRRPRRARSQTTPAWVATGLSAGNRWSRRRPRCPR